MHRRSNALAHAFERMGIGYGDGVGIMCRNHRGFIEATLAAAKLGASALYLNTMFAGPQLVEVIRREGPKALVYDEEFAGLLDGVDEGVTRIVAWTDGERRGADARLADRRRRRLRPQAAARQAALRDPHLGHDRDAEGGAALQPRRPAGDGGAASTRSPSAARETMMIAAPLFHSWGFFHFVISLPTASTIVLRRRFDPEETLARRRRSTAPRCSASCR